MVGKPDLLHEGAEPLPALPWIHQPSLADASPAFCHTLSASFLVAFVLAERSRPRRSL
jgi:hypothetical protein